MSWFTHPDTPKPKLEIKMEEKTPVVTKDEIKGMVEDAIREALEPVMPEDYEFMYWHRERDNDIRGTLKRFVIQAAKAHISHHVQGEVQKEIKISIEPESFLDSIVERLKRKQL